MSTQNSGVTTSQVVEIVIGVGLIALIVLWCAQILQPFVGLIAWGAVVAVAVYPLFLKLKSALGGSSKLAVTAVVLISLAVIVVPAALFADSLAGSVKSFTQSASSGTFHVRPPAEGVKDWPLVGEKAYAVWSEAAVNLKGLLEEHSDGLHQIAVKGLKQVAQTSIGILAFIISIFIAAAFLASANSCSAGMSRLSRRLAGDNGDEMLALTVATVRSVAVGVLGIAFIQAVAGGVGMVAVGVPGAGIWTLAILIVAIAQLPPWLVLGPVIVYVFSVEESSTVAIVFMVWSLIVSFADMFLKPLLLGRGLDVPMLVILLGAIGGMITAGIMGLFVGAVVLALGYVLFMQWLTMHDPVEDSPAVASEDK